MEDESTLALVNKLGLTVHTGPLIPSLPREFYQKVPYSFVTSHKILPFKQEGGKLYAAMNDPFHLEPLEVLREMVKGATGSVEVVPVYIAEEPLQAAIHEFSLKGYGGARVDAICKRARANPRMIYHSFEDKDGLYVSVLGHVLGELRRAE